MKIAIEKRKITPEEPSYLCGHAIRVHLSEGNFDDLFCTTMIIENSNEKYCFVSFDLIMLDEDIISEMKKNIVQLCDIKQSNIFLSVIHTHSGPEVFEKGIFTGDIKTGARPGYRKLLIDILKENVACCLKKLVEINIQYGKVMINGLYGNRNSNDLISDKGVNIIKFVNDDGTLIGSIVNLSCHSTVLGPNNLNISSDLLGAVRTKLEKIWNTTILMQLGASGDVSTRQFRYGEDLKELERVSSGIVEQVLEPINFKTIDVDHIDVDDLVYNIECRIDKDDIQNKINESLKKLETETSKVQIKLLKSGMAFLEHNLTLESPVEIMLKASIIKMGDIIFVTIPGELFSKLGKDIKNAFNNYTVIVWELVNESVGYLVDENEYGKNYESNTTLIPKGEPENFINKLIEKIHSML